MAIVKFQVERRPIAFDGSIYRGLKAGDRILTLTHPKRLLDLFPVPNKEISLSRTNVDMKDVKSSTGQLQGKDVALAVAPCNFYPAGMTPPDQLMVSVQKGIAAINAETLSHVQEQVGEPWLVHSTHYSLDSAIDAATPVASSIGSENVRIVKVLSHALEFHLR